MRLSPHFELEEFSKASAIPQAIIDSGIFTDLANFVLEPIRAIIERPMLITSGYRSPADNRAVHGVPNSQHVATQNYAAADFEFVTTEPTIYTYRMLFDKIRGSATLPFNQVILEHNRLGTSIIHVSFDRLQPGVRSAFEGATYNMSAYQKWDVAPFQEAA